MTEKDIKDILKALHKIKEPTDESRDEIRYWEMQLQRIRENKAV